MRLQDMKDNIKIHKKDKQKRIEIHFKQEVVNQVQKNYNNDTI